MGEQLQKTRYPGVYKTPRGDYTTYVIINGKLRWKTFGRNVREALAWRSEIQSRMRRGDLPEASMRNVTFGDFARVHLSDQLHYERRTHDSTETVLRVHLFPYWGDRSLKSITRRDVQDWVKFLSHQTYSRGETEYQYAPSTVRDIYKHFRKIIRAAVDEGHLASNPCKRVQLPKSERVEQRFLTEAEVECLVAAIDDRYKALVYVSAYLGLRWEEVSALKPSHLELEGVVGRLHVRGTLPRRMAKSSIGSTGKARRRGAR